MHPQLAQLDEVGRKAHAPGTFRFILPVLGTHPPPVVFPGGDSCPNPGSAPWGPDRARCRVSVRHLGMMSGLSLGPPRGVQRLGTGRFFGFTAWCTAVSPTMNRVFPIGGRYIKGTNIHLHLRDWATDGR